ncbi:MAG: hypothetical protein L0216_01460 [Planctomycetales bacterium]|nr:hypothetical protein [Planctomycetales bacterium]
MRHTHSHLPRPVPGSGVHHRPAGMPQGPGLESTTTRTEPEICALCDIANDTFVEPRAFVLAWRLASDGE